MKKIIIIGSGGAGKSTLARQLGEILKIDIIHLDSLYWKPGWVETQKAEWQSTVEALTKQDQWKERTNDLIWKRNQKAAGEGNTH